MKSQKRTYFTTSLDHIKRFFGWLIVFKLLFGQPNKPVSIVNHFHFVTRVQMVSLGQFI